MSKPAEQRWDQFGTDYDQPVFVGKPKVYIIASSGRSGSHLLGNLLFQTGQLGSPLEYLHPKHKLRWQKDLNQPDMRGTLECLMARRSSASGWFGIKAHWGQFSQAITQEPLLPWLDVQRYIRLSRTDRVAQAVSMEIARQTGAWISWQDRKQEPVYDRDAIASSIQSLTQEDEAWDAHFAQVGATPIRVTYENLTHNPHATVASICQDLGVLAPQSAADMTAAPKKQGTTLNDDWVRRFRAE